MRKGILAPWGAATLMTTAVLLWAPALVAGQAPSREETREAARAASPRTAEEAAEYFEAEFERRMAETIRRVYDPTTPPAANPPRTPWGDPDLRGYYLTANYTPLERPEGVAGDTHDAASARIHRKRIEKDRAGQTSAQKPTRGRRPRGGATPDPPSRPPRIYWETNRNVQWLPATKSWCFPHTPASKPTPSYIPRIYPSYIFHISFIYIFRIAF